MVQHMAYLVKEREVRCTGVTTHGDLDRSPVPAVKVTAMLHPSATQPDGNGRQFAIAMHAVNDRQRLTDEVKRAARRNLQVWTDRQAGRYTV